jgi:polyisoprenoid-binding protein YceI
METTRPRFPASSTLTAFPLSFALAFALAGLGAASAKSYQAIKGESTLSYQLVHPMHKITGVSKDFQCVVELSPDTVSSKIQVSAAVSGFDSRNSSRDSHMLEVVEGMKYPRVEFASESVKPEGDGYRVAGTLKFHGVSKPINFHVTPHAQGSKVEITGAFDVSLTEFKVDRPRLLMVPVHDDIRISFDIFSEL